MKKILVIGVKNAFRSIIAAEYLKKAVKEKGKSDIEILQAGIMAFPDIPAEPEAVEQLKGLGITGDFRSTPLSKQAVLEAGLIITMAEKIKAVILAKFPDKSGVVVTLQEIAGGAGDIPEQGDIAPEVKGLIDRSLEKIIS